MKNIEKYTNTKDALEAYNTIGYKLIPFDDWLELEYKDSLPPTLLEAASDAVDVLASEVGKGLYEPDCNFREKMRVLRFAIEREKAKPIRNCDKYKTADEALEAFSEMCATRTCADCELERLEREQGICSGCRFIWLYAEADKAVSE